MVCAPPRVLPRSLAPSGVLGGGRSDPGSPLPGLGPVRPLRAGPWRSCAGGRVWGGGRALCSPFVRPGGPVGRGVALPCSVPLPSLGRQQSGCHWRCSGHGGRGPHTTPVCARPPSLGAICEASWRVGAGSLVPRASCGRWRRGRGGGPCSGSSPGRGEGGPSPLPQGVGPAPPRLAGRWGGWGGGGRVAPRPPCSSSGRRPAVAYPAPPLVVGALPRGVRVRSGSQGSPEGGGVEGRPVDRSPGGPFRPEPPLCPPRVGNGHGGGHGGRGLHTVLVRRRAPPQGLVRALLQRADVDSPVGRDPRGSRQLGTLGRKVCRSSRIPPPPPPPPRVAVPSGGGGASPRLRGGGGSLLWPSSFWGGARGGAGGALLRPPPPLSVGRRPAIRCLRRAPPGYTRAVGVAGRPRASGAARSAANGSVRRGGGGGEGGGNRPAHVGAPAFPRPASEGAAPFAPSWAPPVRRRSAAGRAGACGRFTRGACRGRGAPLHRVQGPPRGGLAAVSSVCLRPLLGLRGRGGGVRGALWSPGAAP